MSLIKKYARNKKNKENTIVLTARLPESNGSGPALPTVGCLTHRVSSNSSTAVTSAPAAARTEPGTSRAAQYKWATATSAHRPIGRPGIRRAGAAPSRPPAAGRRSERRRSGPCGSQARRTAKRPEQARTGRPARRRHGPLTPHHSLSTAAGVTPAAPPFVGKVRIVLSRRMFLRRDRPMLGHGHRRAAAVSPLRRSAGRSGVRFHSRRDDFLALLHP